MKIFLATKNKYKIIELKRILEPMGFDVVSESDINKNFPDVEENGTTFSENAIIKAKAGCRNTGFISVADDSGLCVDALGGAPGVFSARYSGVHGNDEENTQKVLSELKDVPDEKRTARYVCAIACVFPDGSEFVVEGKCEGKILREKTGENGFGYDPIFCGEPGPFGIVSSEEKDAVSHRGKALILFKEKLTQILN